MKHIYRRDYNTIGGKMLAALSLMAVIPYLLLLYLFIQEKITTSETIILYLPLILISTVTGYSLIRRSADSVFYLSRETRLVENGEKSEPIQIQADHELNEIATHFNSLIGRLDKMKRKNQEQATQLMVYSRDLALSYQKTKQEEELRNRLSRYVGNNLVEKLIDLKGGGLVDTERRQVTGLFADIRSFTTIAEHMTAENVVLMLNQYFSVMVDIIFKNNGLLDKFVGDQLIAVFGLVEASGNPAENAIRTAIEMQEATEEMMKKRLQTNQELFEVGIGINTGNAIIGNIGSSNRMDYTVIGDCVNVAARLEEMAIGGEIIIGEQTFLENQGEFNIESRGEVYVKNKMEPVICYNVLRD
ncbi:MAG: adenylate/guanylate cyclase domain-containing protein [Desulfobacteraceae bacterium]|nr:adenylate/guanylate cyclase domain-containing protein [Desulfobacteraceae bacterium]MBC2756670.1 adenylate/guanylate cyclase domain-containing protein [Desulfobacteraceae bacterium]